MIREIYISMFRGIREGRIQGLSQVSLLVGVNGAGKSTVLEAIYLASACAQQLDPVRGVDKLDYLVLRRGLRGTWNGSRHLLWYMGETDTPITVGLVTDKAAYEFKVFSQPKESRPVRLVLEQGRLFNLETRSMTVTTPAKPLSPSLELPTHEAIDYAATMLRRVLLVDANLARSPESVEHYAWPRIVVKRLDRKVVEMLREEFEPEAEGLTYIPGGDGGYFLALQTLRTTVRVDDLGDGARTALLTAMLVLAYRPTVLLIEEPELHMHPAGLYTYMRFLLKLSKEAGFQIIATTHSLELIGIIEALSRELGMELTIHYVERVNDVLKARRFSVDDIDVMRRLGFDVRLLNKF